MNSKERKKKTNRLSHQLGGLDLGTRSNDLCLTSALALRRHGKRVLQVLAEDDVLDEHRLDLDAPAQRRLLNDLANRLGNLLAALNHVLQHARTYDVAQRRLCALH